MHVKVKVRKDIFRLIQEYWGPGCVPDNDIELMLKNLTISLPNSIDEFRTQCTPVIRSLFQQKCMSECVTCYVCFDTTEGCVVVWTNDTDACRESVTAVSAQFVMMIGLLSNTVSLLKVKYQA